MSSIDLTCLVFIFFSPFSLTLGLIGLIFPVLFLPSNNLGKYYTLHFHSFNVYLVMTVAFLTNQSSSVFGIYLHVLPEESKDLRTL